MKILQLTILQQAGICILGFILSFILSVLFLRNSKTFRLIAKSIDIDDDDQLGAAFVCSFFLWFAIFLILPKGQIF